MRSAGAIFAAAFLAVSVLAAAAAWAGGAGGADAVRDAIRRQIIASSPWSEADMEVVEIDAAGYDPANDRFDSVEVRVPKGAPPTGKVSVGVTLSQGARQVRKFWASATVKAYGSAVVALKPLASNSIIGRDDVRTARVEVDSLHGAVEAVDAALGMRVVRPVPAGGILKNDYIRPEWLVRKGQTVSLVADNGRVAVRARGKASRDGALGETVSIKTASGREIAARVTGRGEVTVDF